MSDFLFVLLILFIVFGVFRRYIFYFILGAVSKKLFKEMNRMQQRQAGHHQQRQAQMNREEEQTKKKSFRDSQGEYVDFEEIKD